MISADITRLLDELDERLGTTVKLIDETHPKNSEGADFDASGPISKEARGLAIVLIFAAYENLLKALTRTLLEAAMNCAVSNPELQPRFRRFAYTSIVQSIRDTAGNKRKGEYYTQDLPKFLEKLEANEVSCTVNLSAFPDDGSFMKASQIEVWCKVFDIDSPAGLLRNTWDSINSIVSQRNAIAHGQRKPDEVGRDYTEKEIRQLIADWGQDWTTFLRSVEQKADDRAYFLISAESSSS